MGRFASFLEAHGMPTEVEAIARHHIEAYIAELVETRAANTAASAFRGLQRFFSWAVEEEELARSPMEKMRQVRIPEVPVPLVSDEQLRKLLKTCERSGFEQRRDMALLRVLIDSGMRLAEVSGLSVSDIDFHDDVAHVVDKGRRPRRALWSPNRSSSG